SLLLKSYMLFFTLIKKEPYYLSNYDSHALKEILSYHTSLSVRLRHGAYAHGYAGLQQDSFNFA
ncbi:hypothetical protein ACFL0T_05415, partial [Candidatus Omnitrophota bacterium]